MGLRLPWRWHLYRLWYWLWRRHVDRYRAGTVYFEELERSILYGDPGGSAPTGVLHADDARIEPDRPPPNRSIHDGKERWPRS